MVVDAGVERVLEVENAVEAISWVLREYPRESAWIADTDPKPLFFLALGTVSPSAWICRQALELPLRGFPADVSPDNCVIVGSRWHYQVGFEGPSLELLHEAEILIAPDRGWRDPIRESNLAIVDIHIPAALDAASLSAPGEANPDTRTTNIEQSVGQGAAVAVRALSGMSAADLGALFPVVRESYQRWVTGAAEPSTQNLQRLLALRRLFAFIQDRVGDVRRWLLAPIPENEPATPYEWLSAGRLSAVWQVARGLEPTRSPRVSARLAPHRPTPPEEVDELGDWPDE